MVPPRLLFLSLLLPSFSFSRTTTTTIITSSSSSFISSHPPHHQATHKKTTLHRRPPHHPLSASFFFFSNPSTGKGHKKLKDVLRPAWKNDETHPPSLSPFSRASSSLPSPPTPPTDTDTDTTALLNEWKEELSWVSLQKKFAAQPVERIGALLTLIVFVSYVFISPYAPGAIPNFLDPAVIKQVGGLTLNYFCLLPTLLPTLAPQFSPVMEGIFNTIVAYAALLTGFLVDGRKVGGGKVNFYLPFAAAALVLTNTAYLPYLVLRPLHEFGGGGGKEEEREGEGKGRGGVRWEDLPKVEQQLGESKALLSVYGLAGCYSIWWTFFGRPDFGGFPERWTSFVDLINSDRLMFAFTVELFLFWVFQGSLIDDDMRRRGVEPRGVGVWLAKWVPFVGLFGYMLLRPELPGREGGEEGV